MSEQTMESEERVKLLEIENEIELFSNKLNGNFLKKLLFRMCCSQLSIFDKIVKKQNIKFDEINFEVIFNYFEEMDKTKTNI